MRPSALPQPLVSPLVLYLGAFFFRKKQVLATQPTRILFLKFGALGDVLMTTPLLKAIRQRYPQAALTYATGSWSAVVLKNNPYLAQIVTFRDFQSLLVRLASLVPIIFALRRQRFDLVLVLDRAWQAGVIGRLIGGYTVGFDRLGEGFALQQAVPYGYEPEEQAPHDIDTYLALGGLLGALTTDQHMTIFPTVADREWAKNRLKGVTHSIALCPGGARNGYQPMPQRRWPVAHFITLGRQLLAEGKSIVILGDVKDNQEAAQLAEALASNAHDSVRVINLTGATTFLQAAAVLSLCSSVVVADTALMHAAVAVDTPTIALFGPTNPRRKAPIGSKHHTIWKQMPCGRCGQLVCHWERIAPHSETAVRMQAISPTEIYQLLARA